MLAGRKDSLLGYAESASIFDRLPGRTIIGKPKNMRYLFCPLIRERRGASDAKALRRRGQEVGLVALFKMLMGIVAVSGLATAGYAQSGNAAALAPPAPPPDIIFVNGHIRAGGEVVQAIAISKGIITALGDNAAIDRLRQPQTRRIDLGGATMLPGLRDSHLHPLTGGLAQFACVLAPGARADAIAGALKACVAKRKAGDWIRGGDWVAAAFAPGQQTRAFLDAIAPDNPVVLSDESHHSAWVNSRALALAGITRDTPDPVGGIIERDSKGEPTGLFRELAMHLITRNIPPPTEQEKREALILAANQMLSFGITGFTDAGATAEYIGTLAALSEEGAIKQRIRACLRWAVPQGNEASPSEAIIERRAFYARDRLTMDCVKITLDGVPTESHTAAMLDPYVDGHDRGTPSKGMLMASPDVLAKAVTRFDREGLSVKIHAAGDGAVRAAVDAVAAARRANGLGGPMHTLAHGTLVDPAEISRLGPLDMAWEFSPYIWYPTPMAAKDVRAAVGDRRMERWLPVREALATGALVIAGSDWSVVPSLNPWLAIETMVTRQKPGGSKETLGERESVDLASAFRIFTENAAAAVGRRDREGVIAVGMGADLIVVDRDPFTIPITDLHATKVKLTLIGGEIVYDAASPPKLTAQ
jgi:predicted amidohydrolase YtcJ